VKEPKGHISCMLHAQKRHISFHTPGHKRCGDDITELSYSDNLLSPHGVIARAEEDIARILGARASFILTDGSTCGVHAMLHSLKSAGVQTVAYSAFSHKSVKESCAFLGLRGIEIPPHTRFGVPLQPTEREIGSAVGQADALLLTSPDYYGNFPPLDAAHALCSAAQKPLAIDGAHGAHLHFSPLYAGKYADLWVDGVHKSLPALTQGAVVSAGNAFWADLLRDSVGCFRTSSPSYPIMASVENAVKYPRNSGIERLSAWAKERLSALPNADWSKIVVPFGECTDAARQYLERHGVFAEFDDGNYLMFYLSPCTRGRDLKKLVRLCRGLPRGAIAEDRTETGNEAEKTFWCAIDRAIGRTCAKECGLFPPCVPLIRRGEKVGQAAAERLRQADNVFGLKDGRILVFGEEE